MKLIVGLACMFFLATVSGKRYCRTDSDCNDLGSLQCIHTSCAIGICGCPRGEVARFLGSNDNFGCAKLVKIGDRCSTSGDRGVCAAANSVCHDDRCECKNGTQFESRWGGETCLDVKSAWNSESCGDGIGQKTGNTNASCKGAVWATKYQYEGDLIKDLKSHPLDGIANVVACGEGEHTTLPNEFDVAPYMGGKAPTCAKMKVGDVCMMNDDCKHIQEPDGTTGKWKTGGGECFYNLCKCRDDKLKQDISGLFCGTGLSHGSTCATGNKANDSKTGVCDGTKFLRCGDPCDTDILDEVSTKRTLRCVCDPGWATSSTTCTTRKTGDSCYGDGNCRSLGINAICRKSKCDFPRNDNVAGGGRGHGSVTVLVGLAALLAYCQ